ncbi:class III poly(R)-hydroxyalkanoic acid synthase subunit PhaC [Nitrosopumilus sp. K4]|uniref:class III poly(R)-hydroxyalkanoic acid synthase subunit PhaC n=1 Tax=Nitrosopumilus sp. K4 TaxID=2795383 RepID=UPI001BAB7DEF|nr:class III poly(R)-hydroxyalkanoic acid synthase subunit PhaC [Nitrosopumilus sp. K4]QUC65205.1 class III poly(R)-hydroxyalkanoic acid synthase subunit PhaC [Nitrosopumilus sp. K4]
MKSESRLDPKIMEEILKFSKNVVEAPRLVAAPDEINLEVTPHDVAHQIDKARLLHYKPLTEKQHKTPLIISYALINRYHILDIHPEKSWVRNLLQQGFDVYMLDWGTPTNMDKYLDFDDYVNGYLDSCVEFVKDETSSEKVSLQGYCTGATIATAYTSLHPESVKNFIATAPVIDGWRDTTVISNLAKHIDVEKMVSIIGNMPPEFMYYCFSVLKPFEQGIEKYVNFFKNIDNQRFVDSFLRVERWLGDTPPIPGELFKQWIKDIYQENLLIQNKMYVGGNHIDLKKIDMPIFTQVAVGDHLVSPECSMPLHYAVASQDKTLRIYPTGHVGMIASSISQKKVLPELGQWLAERS